MNFLEEFRCPLKVNTIDQQAEDNVYWNWENNQWINLVNLMYWFSTWVG